MERDDDDEEECEFFGPVLVTERAVGWRAQTKKQKVGGQRGVLCVCV